MKAVSLVCSVVVFCIGTMVLAGWALGNETLKCVVPGMVAMKANTAIGLMLSSIGLALPSVMRPGPWKRAFLLILAMATASIGVITLFEYFFGWNLGIDEVLFSERAGTAWTSHPGRMAPISALCFLLLGGAILAGSQQFVIRVRSPFLAGTGVSLFVMGVISLAGCMAEAWLKKPSWNDSGLAVHTAFSFALLGLAALGRATMLERFHWWLDRAVTAGMAAAIAVMILAAAGSYNFASQLMQTLAAVSHRQEIIREISVAGGGMSSLESARRAYIITADPALLQDRQQTIDTVYAALTDLRRLTADEPDQQQRLDMMAILVPKRLKFADQSIAMRNTQGYQLAQQLISANAATLPNNDFTTLIHALRDKEYRLLDEDRQNSKTASTRTLLVLPMGVFLSLTIACMGLFFHNAGVGERRRMEKGWIESEERFQSVVETMTEGLVISDMEGKLIHWNPAALAMHGFASSAELIKRIPEFVDLFQLSTMDGVVLPVDEWPMARILRGERIRREMIRIRRLDDPWERIFAYGGEVIRQPTGERVAFVTISDISEQARSQQALLESERQLGSFVDQAPVAMAMLDRKMIYLAASNRWFMDFGKSDDAVIGKCHYDIFPNMPVQWREVHRKALEGLAQWNDEDLWMRDDGKRQWLRWAVQPWRDSRGEIGGIMILTEDITLRKESERMREDNTRLEQENRRFAEASRLKSEFLANMSHELRTPLNGIIGFSELLADERPGPVNRKQHEYLEYVLNSGRHLLQLINDVLDLAKVEAGKLTIEPEAFQVKTGIEEVCSVVRGLADQKNVQLISTTSPALGEVRLDPHRFKQICYNLLSNAVKFTKPGGTVQIDAAERDAETFEVRVIDTGIGIKPENLARLFQEFEQLESGASRSYEGTGLGLALTRNLTEMQGGTISVQSEYGKGSTFTVILPKDIEITANPAADMMERA